MIQHANDDANQGSEEENSKDGERTDRGESVIRNKCTGRPFFLQYWTSFFPLQLWMPSFGVSCNTLLLFRMLRTCNLYLYAYLYSFCLSITILLQYYLVQCTYV